MSDLLSSSTTISISTRARYVRRPSLQVLQRYQLSVPIVRRKGSQRFSATLRARYYESQRLPDWYLPSPATYRYPPGIRLPAGEITQVLRRAETTVHNERIQLLWLSPRQGRISPRVIRRLNQTLRVSAIAAGQVIGQHPLVAYPARSRQLAAPLRATYQQRRRTQALS